MWKFKKTNLALSFNKNVKKFALFGVVFISFLFYFGTVKAAEPDLIPNMIIGQGPFEIGVLNAESPYSGSAITLIAGVKNQGTAAVPASFHGRFEIDLFSILSFQTPGLVQPTPTKGFNNADIVLFSTSVANGFIVNGYAEVFTVWANLPEGDHVIRFCIDKPDNNIAELNEDNNCAERQFQVSPALGAIRAPTVTLTANPTSILKGQNSTLAWTSANTTSCSAFWTNSVAISGSGIVVPNVTTTFSITCFGLNGRPVSGSATVFVNQIQQQLTPTVVLFADQESVPFDGAATVRWISANATSCNASGGSLGWTGGKSVDSGSFFTGPLTSNTTYLITCSNNFASATDSVRVAVRQTLGAATMRPTSLVLITSSLDRNQPIVPTINNTKPHPGDEINYAINYQNIGAGAITGLSLRIDLPLEVDYISLNPNNPAKFGSVLIFNLGTLRANGQGSVAVRARLRDDIPAETKLNFLATLSYIDPSGLPQSVSANVAAEVWGKSTADINKNTFLGANVFGTDFLPRNLFEWLILLTLALILIFLAKHLYDQSFHKRTPAVIITDKPSNKKSTANTL